MNKIDFLTSKKMKPKRATIQFLLNFSKSIEIIKLSNSKNCIISKN